MSLSAVLGTMEALPRFLSDATGAELSNVRLFTTLLYGKNHINIYLLVV